MSSHSNATQVGDKLGRRSTRKMTNQLRTNTKQSVRCTENELLVMAGASMHLRMTGQRCGRGFTRRFLGKLGRGGHRRRGATVGPFLVVILRGGLHIMVSHSGVGVTIMVSRCLCLCQCQSLYLRLFLRLNFCLVQLRSWAPFLHGLSVAVL